MSHELEAVVKLVLPDGVAETIVAPIMVSQRTCEAVYGITGRRFLDLLRDPDAPPVMKLGKLRLVKAADMTRFLEKFRGDARSDAEPDDAEKLLAEIACGPR